MKDAAIAEAQRTIADLARTPVGRRWLLKMGVSTAAALAIPSWAAAQGPPCPPAAPRSRRGNVFHFALGPAAATLPDLTAGRERSSDPVDAPHPELALRRSGPRARYGASSTQTSSPTSRPCPCPTTGSTT